jgi:hypothetical protein
MNRWPRLSVKLKHAAFVAIAIALASPGLALAQSGAAPRKIAPDRFPDYGVHAPVAAPSAVAPIALVEPTADRPLGACSRDMPAGDWLRCLRLTVNLADDALNAMTVRIKASLAARADVNDVMRNAWSRALDESHTRWRSLRDYECQQLAMAEPEAPKILLEARLICAIRRDLARARILAVRYRLED